MRVWDREIGEVAITRGGVVVYAECAITGQVTLIETSVEAERLWLLIHTERGPFMLGLGIVGLRQRRRPSIHVWWSMRDFRVKHWGRCLSAT